MRFGVFGRLLLGLGAGWQENAGRSPGIAAWTGGTG